MTNTSNLFFSFQRIARDRNNPNHWLDYGTFCLYLNDLTKVSIYHSSTERNTDAFGLFDILFYGTSWTVQTFLNINIFHRNGQYAIASHIFCLLG